MKRQVTDWEKIVIKQESDKQLVTKLKKKQLYNSKIEDTLKGTKDLKKHITKKDICQWAISTCKGAQCLLSSERYKLKSHWGYHYTQIEIGKERKLKTPNVGTNVKQPERSYKLMGV